MNIQVLPIEVVNQIAAGEVLERPSFLVKELVENSLDAEATEIEVDFANGGRGVVVRDNGTGMDLEELPLALHPHATSKISKGEDIFALSSFGFRGEALASAAAVSKLQITSRPRSAREGGQIKSVFGKIHDPFDISASYGTTVEVSELFENVPARLKFLKSEAAESGHIKSTMKALALSRPDVHFRVLQDSDLKFYWQAQHSLLERAQEVLDIRPLYHSEYELDGVRVEACVSSPLQTAQNSRNIWFFAQNRWIQDRSLMAAVQEAYRNLLMHGEYPQVVVKIQCDPSQVDVNVHPTKSQVKFRDSQAVFRAVVRCIRQVLEKAPWLQEKSSSIHAGPVAFASTNQWVPETEQKSLRFEAPQFDRIQYAKKDFSGERPRSILTSPEAFQWAQLQVIGQVHMTYIVAQSADAFYLVDQHAAHERVMFERLMLQFQKGSFDIQSYLLPLVVDLSVHEAESVFKMKDQLERIGIYIDQMGPESVAINGSPTFVSESGVVEAIKKFAFELSENSASFALERKVSDILATMACHSAIRAGQTLSAEQSKQLLVQMDEFPLSSFCPHGRPVFVRKMFIEVEREFGRIV